MKPEDIKLGIYEKALPRGLDWDRRLALAESLGFQFVEISVDETDERLARLDWDLEERKAFNRTVLQSPLTVPSMCLSGHRRFPFGSRDPEIRRQALVIMAKAIRLAVDTGIRTIQLAGYDVYYEPSDQDTRDRYIEGMQTEPGNGRARTGYAGRGNHGSPFYEIHSALCKHEKAVGLAVVYGVSGHRQFECLGQ